MPKAYLGSLAASKVHCDPISFHKGGGSRQVGGERPHFSIALGTKKAHFYLEREDGMEQGNVASCQSNRLVRHPSLSGTSIGPHILTPPPITGRPSLCALHCSFPLLTHTCRHSLSQRPWAELNPLPPSFPWLFRGVMTTGCEIGLLIIFSPSVESKELIPES